MAIFKPQNKRKVSDLYKYFKFIEKVGGFALSVYTWEFPTRVGLDTATMNRLVSEALKLHQERWSVVPRYRDFRVSVGQDSASLHIKIVEESDPDD